MYSVEYLYRIVDRFSPIMNKMGSVATKFDSKMSTVRGALGKLEDKFKSTGAKLTNLQTGLASIGAGAFLKSALDESTNFQKSMNMTGAVTGATTEQMELMRSKALEWGASTQFSSLQVSGAMAELGKMGNKTNEIISLMPGVMALAAAGEIDMAEAANYSMGILNQFGLSLDNAGMVSDVLARGASMAATSVSGLASAMNNTGLQAAMAGLEITDTTAALAAMASKNLEGAEAGTMMMNALKQLQVMPDKVREGFDKMGIDIDNFRDATTGQMTDFWGLIEAMKTAGATGAQLGEMFDVRAMKAMAILVETNTEELNQYREAVSNAGGASKEMADRLKEGLEHIIEFQSVTQNLKVIMGAFVAEALVPLLSRFNEWLGNMQQNNPEMLKMITYFLMGVTAIGAILIPMGLLVSAVGSIIGVIKGATIATTALTAVQGFLAGAFGLTGVSVANTTAATTAYLIGTKAAAAATKIWTGLQIAFNAVMSANPIAIAVLAVAALTAAGIALYKNWEPVKEFFASLGEKIAQVANTVKDFARGIGGKIATALGFDIGGEAVESQVGMAESAPIPQGYSMANVNANASVSVYTEEGMGVKPFESSGNLGYNMANSYQRGM